MASVSKSEVMVQIAVVCFDKTIILNLGTSALTQAPGGQWQACDEPRYLKLHIFERFECETEQTL